MGKGPGVLAERTLESNVMNTSDLLDLTISRNNRNREELVNKHNLDQRNEEFLRQHKNLAKCQRGENNQFDFGKLTRNFNVDGPRERGDSRSGDN
jgi:hypothetical protein